MIDGYAIIAALGSGAASSVYRARTERGEAVAPKLLDRRLAKNEVMRERFEREGRALNGLDHPHLIRMLDYGWRDSVPYLVMELLEGTPLDELLLERPIAPERPSASAWWSVAEQGGLAAVLRRMRSVS